MKFACSFYQLHPRADRLPARNGALIRMTFDDGLVGYADCHPWDWDLPLQRQLELLKHNQLTDLTKQSLHFARLDAEARAKGVSLFEGLEIPLSHFLVWDLLSCQESEMKHVLAQGFEVVKIKLGSNLQQETIKLYQLIDKFNVRLDFNSKLNREQFEQFLKKMGDARQRIEFCEDPYPFDEHSWQETQERYGVSLALDRNSEILPKSPHLLVVKPAVQDPSLFQKVAQRLVFTSYLDHPLGQMAAAYSAAKCEHKLVCGLQSHLVYRENPFSASLSCNGPKMLPPWGTGFGFDALLQMQEWKNY